MAFSREVLDEILRSYTGPDGILKQLTKALIERAMEAEFSQGPGFHKSFKGQKQTTNRRNGSCSKTLRTGHGPMEIAVPRDRQGEFGPQIVSKHSREWRGFDDKILSMYALGMTTRQIQDHLKEIYAVDVSPELASRVTDEVKQVSGRVAEPPDGSLLPRCFLRRP